MYSNKKHCMYLICRYRYPVAMYVFQNKEHTKIRSHITNKEQCKAHTTSMIIMNYNGCYNG